MRFQICAVIATSLLGCATHTTTSSTTTAPAAAAGAPPTTYGEAGAPREGTVDSIGEVTQRVEGNPTGGAVGGALLGGLVFRSGWGAAAGAAGGAALSSGYSETRDYEVVVRFDDGDRGVFTYRNNTPPFRAGDRVQLTPSGLAPLAG